MNFALFFSLVVSLGTAFQITPTHCSTADVTLTGTVKFVDRQLLDCSFEDSDNTLWNLDRADGVTDGLAKRQTTGAGAVIYIVDSGVEPSHDEFQRDNGTTNVIGGLDPFVEAGENPTACHDDTPLHPCYIPGSGLTTLTTHGTAVASVAAGRTTGVAPGASIVSVRVNGTTQTISPLIVFNRALDDIVKHAFDPSTPPFHTAIVNMSASPGAKGNEPDYLEFERKMKLMIGGVDKDFNADPNGKKFLFVSVAGNANTTSTTGGVGQCTATLDVQYYPSAAGAGIDGLLTVGGVDRDNHLWSGSCRGSAVEVLAPADHVLCASITGHDHYRGTIGSPPFDYSSGTSYAAPYVCGIAARMLEANPNLTPVELEAMIKNSASFIDPSSGTAAGGHVAVLIESPPPSPGPKRRAVAH